MLKKLLVFGITIVLFISTIQIANSENITFYNKWVQVTASNGYAMGLKQDGSLWAWGSNQYGQLGDGTEFSSVPVQVK